MDSRVTDSLCEDIITIVIILIIICTRACAEKNLSLKAV